MKSAAFTNPALRRASAGFRNMGRSLLVALLLLLAEALMSERARRAPQGGALWARTQ